MIKSGRARRMRRKVKAKLLAAKWPRWEQRKAAMERENQIVESWIEESFNASIKFQ